MLGLLVSGNSLVLLLLLVFLALVSLALESLLLLELADFTGVAGDELA